MESRPTLQEVLAEEHERIDRDEAVWAAMQEQRGGGIFPAPSGDFLGTSSRRKVNQRRRPRRIARPSRPWRLDADFTHRALGWLMLREIGDRGDIEAETLRRCLAVG